MLMDLLSKAATVAWRYMPARSIHVRLSRRTERGRLSPRLTAMGHGRLSRHRVRHGRSALSCGHRVAAQRIGEECQYLTHALQQIMRGAPPLFDHLVADRGLRRSGHHDWSERFGRIREALAAGKIGASYGFPYDGGG